MKLIIKLKNGLSTRILETGNTRVSKACHASPFLLFAAGKMGGVYFLVTKMLSFPQNANY